ncbi:MAG: hypothetical protein ACYDB7_09465 [Mycobacteriales bacterium]
MTMRTLPGSARRWLPAARVVTLAATLVVGVAVVVFARTGPGTGPGGSAAADRPRSPAEAVPGLARVAGGFREAASFDFTVAVTATGTGAAQTVRGTGSYSRYGPAAARPDTFPDGLRETLRAVGARTFLSVPAAGLARTQGRHWLGFPRSPVTATGDLLGLLADNPLDLLGAFSGAPPPRLVGPAVLAGVPVTQYDAEVDTGPLGPASYLASLARGELRAFVVSFTSGAGIALQVSVTITATGVSVRVPVPPSSDVRAESSAAAALAVLTPLI